MEQEKVLVSNIVEYNWMLGARCYLLARNGLHPYSNTEEEIIDFLKESAKDSGLLSFCCESSRCGAFHEAFMKAETPFTRRDPIRLLEYDGKYWVYEGKHRVCMAIRSGVKYIDARVHHLEKDTESLIDPCGTPGIYTFKASYGLKHSSGELAILWLNPPRGSDYSEYSIGPIALNTSFAVSKHREEVIPGVFVEIKRKSRWNMLRPLTVEATVTIEPEHYNTAIWLYCISSNRRILSEPRTLFRYGRWRRKHLPYMIPSSRNMI